MLTDNKLNIEHDLLVKEYNKGFVNGYEKAFEEMKNYISVNQYKEKIKYTEQYYESYLN